LKYSTYYLFLLICLFFLTCKWEQTTAPPPLFVSPIDSSKTNALTIPTYAEKGKDTTFNRSKIMAHLQEKIATQKPLVIHVFVPLCDNEHQGIVPVSKALGDGQNPMSNLYWGALYGVKTHFRKSKKWTLLQQNKNVSEAVLERVIFERKIGQTPVYLVADAYDGRSMKTCLQDYFAAMAGVDSSFVELTKGKKIAIASAADLLVFNGHNGLMDVAVVAPKSRDGRQKDAVVIACVSGSYFTSHLLKASAYPLVMTTNFLAPEAYVLEAIFEEWLQLNTAEQIRSSAGKAYHRYQKCGLKGANRLFSSGWGILDERYKM